MIQLIGFMIGTYIFTRMCQLISEKGANGFIGFSAVITLIIVTLCMSGLFVSWALQK